MAEVRDRLTPEEIANFEEHVERTKHLGRPKPWQIQTFNDHLQRKGVTEGQLFFFEYEGPFNGAANPQRFLLDDKVSLI